MCSSVPVRGPDGTGAPPRPRCAAIVTAHAMTNATVRNRPVIKSPDESIQVEVPIRFGNPFLARLLERFIEPLLQRVTAPLLRLHRLLEDRLAPRRFLGN